MVCSLSSELGNLFYCEPLKVKDERKDTFVSSKLSFMYFMVQTLFLAAIEAMGTGMLHKAVWPINGQLTISGSHLLCS